MTLRTSRFLLVGLVVGLSTASGVLGCAAERDPINRVQSNAVPKSFFLGPDLEDHRDDPEFRTKSYNIDSGANTDNYAGTIGGASALDRVRFEVTENWLFARRSYQESPGADNRGLPRKEVAPGKLEFPTKPTGTIVAAYKILSHFDIRRSYNAQTGEEQNVVEENTTDRPWYQREYVRVDWSKNVAESTSGDISWVFGDGSSATAIEYAPTDETNEDRPHFEAETGYFDITNKYQLKPQAIGSFGVPECVIVGFFNGSTSFDCSPTEVKVRSSFVRLTGEEDFEPFEESLAPRDIVGNWGNAGNSFNREYGGPPLSAWDPQYGYTDANTKTFYAIHNLWEHSHQNVGCASNADDDKDGTADACTNDVTGYGGHTGSQCDVHIGRCTIPVRDRKVRTIAYWLNTEAPQDLTDVVSEDGKGVLETGPIEEMTVTWNQLMKVAVATRREVECRRTLEGDRESCHAEYFDGAGAEGKEMVAFGGWGLDRPRDLEIDEGRPTVTTCHNPVRAYDLELCGKPGEVIRLGDVRKNYAIYWPYASRAPYGGVASIGGDPLTGEMAGVSATTMMRSATMAAAQQRDIIQLALGDVKIEDYIQGVQASRYVDSLKQGKQTSGMAKAISSAQLAELTNQARGDLTRLQAAIGESPAELATISRPERQLRAALFRAQSSPQTATIAAANDALSGLMTKVEQTEHRAHLANKGLLRLTAESADRATPVYEAISTFAQNDPSRVQDLLDTYQAFLGKKGICFSDPAGAGAAGTVYQASLAPYFKRLYGGLDVKERGEKIYRDLLREAVKGIALHEIGHSLGLRHNFASSWDSLNYGPQYWQLRTAEGKATAPCAPGGARPTSGGDSCLGPRYLDPLTDDEQGATASEPRPAIEYFANTSTMEYQIERFGETVGAGTYDLHAMKTLYGRVLETFDAEQVPPAEQQNFAVKMLSQGISKDIVFDANKGYGAHYTKAALQAKVFDPSRDCRAATPEEKARAKWRIVHDKVCAPAPKNHLAYEDLKSSEIAFELNGRSIPIGANGVRWSGVDEDGKRLVRWPYRYGEDYSRGGYVHAKPGDAGADVYEITANTIRKYEATYPMMYFRRQNKEFAWWSLPSYVGGQVFARLRGYHWTTTTDIGRASVEDLADDDQERPSVVAAAMMFDFLQQVILTPEPGTYGDTLIRTPKRPGALKIFDLQTSTGGIGTGNPIGTLDIASSRFVQVDFDNDRGGSWDYQQYVRHAGFDEEKVLAIRELVDARPTLSTVSRENALDGRDPYISFRTDTPHAVDRLLGALLSEDWETIAPSMASDGASHVTFSVVNKDPSKLVRPANAKGILFPNVGYSNEVGAGIYALVFSRFSSDMTLANKLRIRLEGDAGPVVPEDRKITFTDPLTGHRYVAAKFGTETIQGRAVETGIASRMLERANDLLALAYEVEDPEAGSVQPVVKNPEAERELRRYIGLLDAMRQIGNLVGGGPLGSGGGG